MADDNDISIGPGSDDDDDDSPSYREDVSGRTAPPPLIDLRKGPAPAAPATAPTAAAPADGQAPAITPKAAPPVAPAAPAAPAARPAAPAGTHRLVSDAPVGAPPPAPATPTPTAPTTTDALASQLASLQKSIESLTSKVETGQPAAAAPSAPAAPAAAAAEAEPTEVDEEAVARDLATFAEKDRDCAGWNAEFIKNNERMKALEKGDGEYHLLSRSILVLQAQLDPKGTGIEGEIPDDVTRAEIEAKLEPKLAKQERLKLEYQRLATRNKELDGLFSDRVARAETKIRGRFQEKAQTAQAGRDRKDAVSAGEREWHGAFKTEVLDKYDGLTYPEGHAKAGQPNESALFLFTRLIDRGYAAVSADPDLDFATFIRDNVGDEILVLNSKRGKANTEAARAKVADSAVPAPRGQAAVADAARPLSEITDPRERRRQVDLMTARASKRLTLQRTG